MMGLVKDIASFPAALRLILGAAAAFGLVVFVAQIPPGTISQAAPKSISSADAPLVPPSLSTADEGACELLQRALLRVARGMEFDRALTNYAFVPWTAGQPSLRMRSVFASFQRATALQQGYMRGESTQRAAADVFNSSVAAYAQLCEAGV